MSDGTQPRGGGRPTRLWRDEVGLALVFLRYPGHKEEEAYFEKVQSGGVTEQGAPST